MPRNVIVPKTLSGSTNGRGIKVVATATPGTLLHETGISNTDIDEITLFAYGSGAALRALTVEFGGVTVPDDNIIMDVPFKNGLNCAVFRGRLKGTGATKLAVRAFCAAAANEIVIFGEANTITP